MTVRDDLDRSLEAWLTETAPMRAPDHLLGQVLARTERTKRRAAWRIPERWLPMSTITSGAARTASIPWRTVGLIALLILAIVAGAAVVIGSRQPRLPAPFGPAANGQLAFSVDGDILVTDSLTSTPRTIVGGPTADAGPLYSPDGTKFAFVRGRMDSADAELWVADADGTDQRRLRATPFIGWVEWAPQSDILAVHLDGDLPTIYLVAADGSGTTEIDTGLLTAENTIWRPSDGRQLLFRGQDAERTRGFYLVDRDGSNLRRLDLDVGFQADPSYDINREYYFNDPAWSADGSRLLYHTLEPSPQAGDDPGFRIRIATLGPDGAVKDDRVRTFDPRSDDEYTPILTADGDTIVYQAIEGTTHRLKAGSVSGDGPGRDLGLAADDYWIGASLSPDGRQLVATLPVTKDGPLETWSVDVTSGVKTKLGFVADGPAWQRVAAP